MAKPLSTQLSDSDGWFRTDKTTVHFKFQGQYLCETEVPEDEIRDNKKEHQCQKCFERVRNLYNYSKPEDAFKDH